MNHHRFVRYIASLDRAALAALRRGRAFEPGEDVQCIAVVEPVLDDKCQRYDRMAYYIVASLMAHESDLSYWLGEEEGSAEHANRGLAVGKAVRALFLMRDESPSIEKRFLAVLDADMSQLMPRLDGLLRIVRANGIMLDYVSLLGDICRWANRDRRVQVHWARDFYRRHASEQSEVESNATSESNQLQESTK